MENENLLDVTVVRSEWGRGDGMATGKLYNGVSGKRCCIGFVGKAVGISDTEMWGVATAARTDARWPAKFWDVDCETETGKIDKISLRQAYITNDATGFDDCKREQRLTKLGRAIGVNFKFVD